MATLRRSLHPLIVTGVAVTTALCVTQLAFFSTVAVAQTQKRARSVLTYIPPNRGTPTRGIRGAGSRGCSLPLASSGFDANKLVQVTLLVPSDHVGQTTASHPSFFWHVSATPSVPMEFSLVQPGVAKPLLVKQISVTKPGIVELALPPDQPGLEVGKRYRWSVALVCNSDRRSNDVFAQSWIERVAADGLEQPVVEATPAQQIEAYAKAGLWYDALRIAAMGDATNPVSVKLDGEFQALLEQGGLPEIIAQLQQ